MTIKEAKEIFINRGYVNGLFDGDKWRQSVVAVSKWLEQEPCEDCISRADAIKAMDDLEREDVEAYGCSIPEGFDGKRAKEALEKLPSIKPKRDRGYWYRKYDYGNLYCSKCNHEYLGLNKYPKYCEKCGAIMEEETNGRG